MLEKSDAERIILGAILLGGRLLKQVDELMPNDFYDSFHQAVFRAMRGLSKESKEINPVLIGEKMKAGTLEAFGGVAAITNLTYGLPHLSGIESYVSTVRQKSVERRAVKLFGDAVHRITNGDDAQPIIQNALCELQIIAKADNSKGNLFAVKSVSKWINESKSRPVPKMLFGEFWFEGELCILFADTGKGKSILAVQIADAISKGEGTENFTLEAAKQKILYLDFELSAKQFEARYSQKFGNDDYFSNHFEFNENFFRAEINQNSFLPSGFVDFETYLNFSLESQIIKTDAKILVVDNITYLKNATETAKDALPLMKEFIRLKKKHGLSILCLAHTPKRDLSRPLTVNDLQGSKMLSNFADSIFAIGESAKDKSVRYLKQIKARNTEIVFDAENVAVGEIAKPSNFLKFEFSGFGSERQHLKEFSEVDRESLIERAKQLSALGESQRKIASELGISLGAVNKYLKMESVHAVHVHATREREHFAVKCVSY